MNDKNIYDKAYKRYGESPKSLHWVSYASQAIRFKYLVAELDIEHKSILDAGCGMGDLLPFLYAKADRFRYLGVDISQNFVEVAKKRYSGHSFIVGDVFSDSFTGSYDTVISSGVMNQNIPNWLAMRKHMIKKLFGLSSNTLAFNMAGSLKPIPPDSKIAYANAGEILEFCKTLTPKVSLRSDYSSYDFTVVMQR